MMSQEAQCQKTAVLKMALRVKQHNISDDGLDKETSQYFERTDIIAQYFVRGHSLNNKF